jgi:hypothetical protein
MVVHRRPMVAGRISRQARTTTSDRNSCASQTTALMAPDDTPASIAGLRPAFSRALSAPAS